MKMTMMMTDALDDVTAKTDPNSRPVIG